MQSLADVTLWSRDGSWLEIQDKQVDSECPKTVVTMKYAVGHEDKISLKPECKQHDQVEKKRR